MASSSAKPGAVHFALIFFVMLSVILGVVAYMKFNERDELASKIDAANKKAGKAEKALKQVDSEVQLLKRLAGYPEMDVGLDDEANTNTVHGAVLDQITALSKALPQVGPINNARDLANELHQRLLSVNKTVADANVVNNTNDARIQVINSDKQGIIDLHIAAKDKEIKRVQENIDEHSKIVQSKDTQISGLQGDVNSAKRLHQQDVSRLQAQLEVKDDELKKLKDLNEQINEKLEALENLTFEVADGLIRTVDQQNGLAWINLGSNHNLTRGITFSVYRKDNLGVGRRGQDDVKGAIEVTRIISGDMAECKILDQSSYEPIAKNDPIYTPLWEAGRVMRFSFVGYIDMDGDGRYSESERKQLHDIVAANGGRIDNEVGDDGELAGNGLSVHTKFLVIGEIPETQNPDPSKQGGETKIRSQFKKLNDEARMHGVRRISLNDFLAWVGYVPKQRIFRPGENYPYKLKSGAASASVNQTVGDRASSGQVSGAFGGRKSISQATSSGQTSGAFGGGNRYRK